MPEKPANSPFSDYKPDDTFSPAPPAKQVYPEDIAMPFLALSGPPMELFSPKKHLAHVNYRPSESHSGATCASPPLPLYIAARANPQVALIPREKDCLALWEKYVMLENIRDHSRAVAGLALAICRLANEKGIDTPPEAVYAAGLLHDLGKTYTIAYGGNHAQLGAAWTMHETRNAMLAHCVLYHVHWPWEEHFYQDSDFPVMVIEYADKRVRHDNYVSLEERFADLLVRYGKTDYARERIAFSLEQGKRIENTLSRRLGVNLDEYIADSGRLVKRT